LAGNLAGNFRFFGHFWRFPMSIRTAISVPRTPNPYRQGQGIGFAVAGNFLRQRRELTCQGREFVIFGESVPKK
jgi:hypothetical protein